MKRTRKNIGTSTTVIAISILFIASAYIPAVGSQFGTISPRSLTQTPKILDLSNGNTQSALPDNPMNPPLPLDDPWWNQNWQYRRMITIDHLLVTSPLSNFPVLVSFTSDASLAAHARDDGYDIAFVTQTGTKLNHEIELFDGGTGKLYAWVNITSLSSTVDTIIYMYYGYLTASNQQNVHGVWDSSFVMVHHLHEASGIQHDSTINGNDGAPTVTMQGSSPGKIDGADLFDGVDDHIKISHNPSLNLGVGDFTLSAWVKYTNCVDTDIMRKGDMTNSGAVGNYKMEVFSNQISGTVQGNGPGGGGSVTTPTTYSDNQWHYAVFQRESGTLRLYVDGGLIGTASGATKDLTNPANASIGSKDNYNEDFFTGTIDELQLSKTARSANWIVASYRTVNGQCISYGSEETRGDTLQLTLASPTSTTYSTTTVPLQGTTNLNANIKYRLDGAVNVSVGNNILSFSASLTGLSYATHTIIVYAVDSTNASNTDAKTILFVVAQPSAAWADETCQYRKKITFNNTLSSGDLIDFPVLIRLNSSVIDYSKTSATDIRFYDGTTLLPKETESWNASGTSYVWVKVPRINATNNDSIYLYYGSSSTNGDAPAAVWTNEAMVLHLKETSGQRADSTGNSNAGMPSATVTKAPGGQIDGADSFDGTSSYLNVADAAGLNFGAGSFSYSFWFNSKAMTTQDVFDKKNGTADSTFAGYKMTISSAVGTGFSVAVGDGTNNVRLNTGSDFRRGGNVWALFTVVVDRAANTMTIYLDGAYKISASISTVTGSVTNTNPLRIGGITYSGTGRFFSGYLDEIHVSNVARSPSWVNASYRSMKGQFISYGAEEIKTSGLQLTVTSPIATPYYTNIVPLTGITSINADIKYRLDGAVNVSVGNNVLNFSTLLTGLSCATHTIIVYAADHVNTSQIVSQTVVFSVVNSPPGKPTNPHPLNGSVGVSINPQLNVTVHDPNGDTMNVSFYAAHSTRYDYSTMAGKQAHYNTVDTEPPTSKIPAGETLFSPTAYANISLSDDMYYTTTSTTQLPYHRFNVTINEDVSSIESINVAWEGHSLLGRTVTLYAWNFLSNVWVPLKSGSGTSDFTLTGSVDAASMVQNHEVQLLVQDWVPSPSDYNFTFTWMSDTQNYCTDPALALIFDNMTQWMATNKIGKKIVYAMHSGDIENGVNIDIEWKRANHSMRILENASIPWGIAAGNHDNGQGAENWTFFNTYFGPWRFLPKGYYHNDQWTFNQNHYDLLTFNGVPFVIVYLGDGVDTSEMTWARNVFQNNSNRIGILVTHEYIGTGGGYSGDGSAIYTNVVAPCGNVVIVLCGHLGGDQLNIKTIGNRTLYEILSNYQGLSNGGGGYFKLFYFNPQASKVYVNTYSPKLNSFDTQYSYDEFNLTIPMPVGPTSDKQVSTDYIKIDVVSKTLLGTQSGVPDGGVASVPWAGLSQSTTYQWYTTVRDAFGQMNQSDTWFFTTQGPSGSWADPTCQYRKKVTFNNTASSEDLVDFPVLIKLAPSTIDYSKTSATDIRFYDGSTLLPKETETWNSTGESFIWVKVPRINTTNGGYIHMYYDSTTTNLDNAAAVWTNEAMVLHLKETSGMRTDSSGKGNAGTPSGVTKAPSGQIDGADSFDGSLSYINVTTSNSLNFGAGSFSYSFWLYSKAGTTQDVFDKKGGTAGDIYAGYKMTISSVPATGFSVALGDGARNVRLDTGEDFRRGGNVWAMFTVVVDRTAQTMTVYLDGASKVSAGISTILNVTNTNPLRIGVQTPTLPPTRQFNGYLDEVRISNVARSPSWVNASYRSMKGQFTSYGAEEQQAPNQYTLTLTVDPLAGGTVVALPPPPYNNGAVVTLTAIAYPGYSFSGWSGNLSGFTNPTTIQMTGNKTVTAHFVPNEYTLSVIVEPVGSGVVAALPVPPYHYLDSVQLTATAYPGYNFNGWTGDLGGALNPTTITMTSNKAITAHFIAVSPDSWVDTTCQYRKKITFDNHLSSGSLLDFPVLVKLNTSTIDYSKTNATDIRFYDGSTLLPKETETWNPSGESYIWVKVPQIENTLTDYITIYYHSTTTNLDSPTTVWSNEAMVLHLKEASGPRADSTGAGNAGTPTGVTKAPSGPIDGADSFDGASSYLNVADAASLNFGTSSFSYSFWFYSKSGVTQDVLDKKSGSAGEPPALAGYKMTISSVNTTGFSAALGDGVTSHTVRLDTGSDYRRAGNVWALFTVVVDRTTQTMSIYIDGAFRVTAGIQNVGNINNTNPLRIGSQTPSGTRWFNGYLDEVRISNVARTPDWINASYRSMKGLFTHYGAEEEATAESTPPEITVVQATPSTQNAAYPVNITCVVTDNVAVRQVYLHVTDPNNNVQNFSIAENKTGNIYYCNRTYSTLGSYQYFIWANDTSGNSVESVQQQFIIAHLYTVSANAKWNTISLPFNETIPKTSLRVRNNSIEYSWGEAISNGILMDVFYYWNTTTGSYGMSDTMAPGVAYWIWAYYTCDLLVLSPVQQGARLAALRTGWDFIGLDCNTSLAKQTLIVRYDNVDYTWAQATTGADPIILAFIYGWNKNNQMYSLSDVFDPGCGYWVYAYKDCLLKKGS